MERMRMANYDHKNASNMTSSKYDEIFWVQLCKENF